MLKIDKPLYNTIIVFTIVIFILYIAKPTIIYDHKKQKFKHIGINKTVPIYSLIVFIAIIIYLFFFSISINKKKNYGQEIEKLQNQLNNIVNNTL